MAGPNGESDDNPGTVLESVSDIVRTLTEKGLIKASPSGGSASSARPAPSDARSEPQSIRGNIPANQAAPLPGQLYRPIVRPPTPVLTVLDDGLIDRGQEIRLRGDSFIIGRTDGDLILSHDSAISGRHAKITRIAANGRFKWHLEDLGSANGTFVLVRSVVLLPDMVVMLGGRQFRLEEPGLTSGTPAAESDGTRLVNASEVMSAVLPALVEANSAPGRLRFEIRGVEVVIGNSPNGVDISLDDPLVSPRHAVLKRQANGQWKLECEKTPNGVWVRVPSVRLVSPCAFQCGEQRFRFEIT
jgi:pSer/pThr/pTyr-binding forkhead associated (FHA) protein